MLKAIVVKTDGSVNEVFAEWDYDQISKEVGGYIEAVYFNNNDYFAYVNEEGKMLNLPENKIATELWYNSGRRILLGDYLAGDAVFFGEIDDNGDSTDAPQKLFDELTKIVKGMMKNVS